MNIYELLTTLYSTTASGVNDENDNLLATYLSATTTVSTSNGWKEDLQNVIDSSMLMDSMSKQQIVEFEEKLNNKEKELDYEIEFNENKPKVFIKRENDEKLF